MIYLSTEITKNLDVKKFPKITVITPSLNYGKYITDCITSVIRQNYPNLEYIVIDGASRDNTVDIIRNYEQHISCWISEPDDGAAYAISKGYSLSSGDLINWLNADDYYLPGFLLSLGTIAGAYPDYDVYAFLGAGSGEYGAITAHFSSWPLMYFNLISNRSAFGQESTFVKKDFLTKHNIHVRTNFQALFDVVFFDEILAKGGRVLFVDVFGGVIRHHATAKTSLNQGLYDREAYLFWSKEMFSVQQRLWRRLNQTRFHQMQRFICNTVLGRRFISYLLNQSYRDFHVCTYKGGAIYESDSWVVATQK